MKESIQTLIKNTRGFERMQLYALTCYIGLNAARFNQPHIKNKKKAIFVSLEMTKQQITKQIVSMLGKRG